MVRALLLLSAFCCLKQGDPLEEEMASWHSVNEHGMLSEASSGVALRRELGTLALKCFLV